MIAFPFLRKRNKKTVLLVLQGAHQLALYTQIFEACPEFRWVCSVPDPRSLSAAQVERLYRLYGVQIFADRKTSLASFRGIDAVLTTYGVPHSAHAAQMSLIALAYEMGLPVFELQHGMYQIGINYSERSAYVGSGLPGALTSLGAPNFVDKRLVWGEAVSSNDISIGYPPFVDGVVEAAASRAENAGSVLVATNLHWNIISPDEVQASWNLIFQLVSSSPDIPFVMMPHPGEMSGAAFKRFQEQCSRRRLRNVTVQRPDDRAQFTQMLMATKVAVSMVSTVLLDFEMYGIPTVILPVRTQHALAAGLQAAVCPPSALELIAAVRDGFYDNDLLVLRTGMLRPFECDRLVAALENAFCAESLPDRQVVPLISKYLARG